MTYPSHAVENSLHLKAHHAEASGNAKHESVILGKLGGGSVVQKSIVVLGRSTHLSQNIFRKKFGSLEYVDDTAGLF